MLALLESGSDGRAYLLKERVHDLGQLISAIEAVAAGGSVIDPKIVEVLVAARARGDGTPMADLTEAERRVLAEIAQGKSNVAIADSLHLSKPLWRSTRTRSSGSSGWRTRRRSASA